MESTVIREEADTRARTASAGKYLTFTLGREEYGLPVLNVREVIKVMIEF